MKNLPKILLAALVFATALAAGFNALAQYPAASVLVSANNLGEYSINSTEDYVRVEDHISSLGIKMGETYKKYPNLNYTPVLNGEEIVAFMITGVNNSAAADEISTNLMQLEMFAQIIKNMDDKYLPSIKDSKLSRVSKKEASK